LNLKSDMPFFNQEGNFEQFIIINPPFPHPAFCGVIIF
jgi:hypothetical protein